MDAATGSSSSPVDEENPPSQEQPPEISIQMPQPQPLPQPQPEPQLQLQAEQQPQPQPQPQLQPELQPEPEPESPQQLQSEQQPQPPPRPPPNESQQQLQSEQQPQPQPPPRPPRPPPNESQQQLQSEPPPRPPRPPRPPPQQLQSEPPPRPPRPPRPLPNVPQQQQPQPQPPPRPPRPPPNVPAGNLLGSRVNYNRTCVPLYHALMKGDWEAAKVILGQNRELVRSSITENCETPLHIIAASAKSTKSMETFVRYLVNLMTPADLALQNRNHNTALCVAAAAGNVEVARIMVGQHNRVLLTIPGYNGMMPLEMAALLGHRDMVNYLYETENMDSPLWTDEKLGLVLVSCTATGFFDIAWKIVYAWPTLAENYNLLGILARNPDAFTGTKPPFFWIRKIFSFICRRDGPDEKESQALQFLRTIWTKIVALDKWRIYVIIRGPADTIRVPANQIRRPAEQNRATYSSRVLFVATEMGNTKFVVELIRQYPDLIWSKNEDNQSIFHVAVSNRQEGIYSLLYETGSVKDTIAPLSDVKNNNMLHLVGKIAKKKQLEKVSGVALQMQRELLWFKEVEAMIPPFYRELKNDDGLTPHELFTKEHKVLMSEGEKWMKDTASHCMVVATLIATMVFAAAFTIPGGYNTGNGIPELRKKRAFIAFVISDAISLFSSSMSILMFLSILTSRYAEHDFMESLPKKLIRGLATLFLSMISMMVAFSVSFFALYYNHLLWVPVIISFFPVIPTILFARQHSHLLADLYRWTYGSRNLFKPKFMLYKIQI